MEHFPVDRTFRGATGPDGINLIRWATLAELNHLGDAAKVPGAEAFQKLCEEAMDRDLDTPPPEQWAH